jgi:hypothetical protein
MQLDHVPPGEGKPHGQLADIGHYLLGLADLFEMISKTLREFGAWLISASRSRDSG